MAGSADPGISRLRMMRLGVGAAFALALFAFLVWQLLFKTTSLERLNQARDAQMAGQLDTAIQLLSRIRDSDPLWPRAQLMLGEIAFKQEDEELALRHYQAVPRDGSAQALQAAFYTAELLRDQGHLLEAAQDYQYVLDHQQTNAAAEERMAFLLGVSGQRRDSESHFMALLKMGSPGLDELVFLGDLERHLERRDFLEKCRQQAPQDPFVILGLASDDIAQGKPLQARPQLEQVLKAQPELLAAQALLGEILVDESPEEFKKWHRQLPAAADQSPEIWFVRGLFARKQAALPIAARCFWETVRQSPDHRRGNYQLGQVLFTLEAKGKTEFSQRAALLFELTGELDKALKSQGQNGPVLERIVQILEACGRIWEACAWSSFASENIPNQAWAGNALVRLTPYLGSDPPRTLPDYNLAARFDYSQYPEFKTLLDSLKDIGGDTQPIESPAVQFRVEPAPGFSFTYNAGSDPATPGARMFEQTGGGVAVIDFDRDDRPDLYFTQGGTWPTGASAPPPPGNFTDQLLRNIAGQRFTDVSGSAQLVDSGFGQGCTVADLNSDGFPDLYVANIGPNQILINNGDGTFTDPSAAGRLAGNDWTTSCAAVDLNADGLTDLFDVNYVSGSDVYIRTCNNKACSPKVFEGTPDRLWLNQGDGTFKLIADATPAQDSKGLGIVAADFYDRGRPSLFIANDQVPNFLLRNYPAENLDGIQLVNEAFASGLGFNQDGLAMACMGIAADDVDGNGQLDLLVTNFKDESNTLYLQDSPGLFLDATNAAGLVAPSLPYVGWGTQFLDADLDGDADLVVANGHVDDYRDEGGEFQMRPQFFINDGQGHFTETSSTAGDYFAEKYLGRGLSRLDWNADGRPDFVVSNIGSEAQLVTNQTETKHHWLAVRVIGTSLSRDAIGTVITVRVAGEKSWTKQLVAGDGYMASNERKLQFGLGATPAIESVQINWTSGQTVTLTNVPVDAQVTIAEGASTAVVRQGDLWNSIPVVN